jgi:hypothetical protein
MGEQHRQLEKAGTTERTDRNNQKRSRNNPRAIRANQRDGKGNEPIAKRERIFRRSIAFFRKSPAEIECELRYEYITANKDRYEVSFMCVMLEVSRSGYYKHVERKQRPEKNAVILSVMHEILAEDEENENYGKVRMRDALRARGVKCSRERCAHIMDENGLRVSKKRSREARQRQIKRRKRAMIC